MTFTIDPRADLGMQIAALAANPIVTAAQDEVDRQPTRIHIPDLKYSDEILTLLREYEALWETWAELNTDLVSKLDDYQTAYDGESVAIRKAAADGAAKHPGRSKSTKALEDLEWATAKTVAKREELNRLAAGQVDALIEAGADEYLRQIHVMVENAEAAAKAAIDSARMNYEEARLNANRANESLAYFRDSIKRRYGATIGSIGDLFDPLPTVNWPKSLKLEHARSVFALIANHPTAPDYLK